MTGSGVELPWREYVQGKPRDRIIRPDALLEVPEHGLRVFVEAETGSQPLRSRNPDRIGATAAKLARYLSYVVGVAHDPGMGSSGRTWYQQRFPDGLRPQLLLLVPGGRRLAHTRSLVEGWDRRVGAQPLRVKVLTTPEAIRHYGALAGLDVSRVPDAPPAQRAPRADAVPSPAAAQPAKGSRLQLSPGDVEVMDAFFTTMRADLKHRQAQTLIEQQQEPGRAIPMPEVPARYDDMKALVRRLRSG